MFTVLSHNACWFQGFPYEGLDPDAPHPEVLDRLVALYTSLDPHVVCIQEVQHTGMADQLSEQLGMAAHHTPGGEYPVYGCATFAPAMEPLVDGAQSNPAPHRAWQICTIPNGDETLTIANLHLTSDRFIGKAAADRQRIEDLQSMLAHKIIIDVICGDFNEGPRETAAILLEGNGFTDAAVATAYDLPSTGVNKSRSDQIWVRDALVPHIAAFGAAEWESLRFDAPGKNVLSDHLPLWLELS
jgi:endonuclease/exonuclease/phosphatase family metal-dependent hydrolase